jgi:hypothetical protein
MSRKQTASSLQVWNRKIHIYLGLYLLTFIWLFAVSGILLNHSEWQFHDFWPDRKESTTTQTIQRTSPGDRLATAHDLMTQLGISGEVDWTNRSQAEGHFDFRVTMPGRITNIKTDLDKGEATVQQIDVNWWGVLKMLHAFTGVRQTSISPERDWLLTKVWSFSLDAVAVGLIAMVCGGYYMWWVVQKQRALGALVLITGFAVCGFFVTGLAWWAQGFTR